MQNINQRSKQDGEPYWVHMLKGRERHQLPPCWSPRSNNSYQNPNKSLCIYNPQNSKTCVERQKIQCRQHPLSPGHVYSWPLVARFPLLLRKPSVALMHTGSPSHLQLNRICCSHSLLFKKPLPNAQTENNQFLPSFTSRVWMTERV